MEEVGAAILATLLNKDSGVHIGDGFAIVSDKESGNRERIVQIHSDFIILTIRMDNKTPVSKKAANKLVDLLLELAKMKDFTSLPNRLIADNIIKLLKREKAVTSIVYKNDTFNTFRSMIEGVTYIIEGVRLRIEGTADNCFVHVQYENLAKKVDRRYAVMSVNSAGDYAIGDPLKERFYYVLDPLATLLNLTK